MNIVQTSVFKKTIKKLHANQKSDLDKAVKSIMEDPNLGQSKTGDLSTIKIFMCTKSQ
jgi:hypothetical protein